MIWSKITRGGLGVLATSELNLYRHATGGTPVIFSSGIWADHLIKLCDRDNFFLLMKLEGLQCRIPRNLLSTWWLSSKSRHGPDSRTSNRDICCCLAAAFVFPCPHDFFNRGPYLLVSTFLSRRDVHPRKNSEKAHFYFILLTPTSHNVILLTDLKIH
jgi:hypothetical protein